MQNDDLTYASSAKSTNDNGERLLTLGSTSNLSIWNTFLVDKRIIHKTTWTSQDDIIKNAIDYICISTR